MGRNLIILLFVFGLVFAAAPRGLAQAVEHDNPAISEEVLEARAKQVGRALRCVVCQNQSIEESNATLAVDMRQLVRARIAKGESNEQVIDYMQSRYGDFVLLEPPVQSNTYVLWALPFILLLLGLLWFWRAAKRQSQPPKV